jgi:hypothetical protein
MGCTQLAFFNHLHWLDFDEHPSLEVLVVPSLISLIVIPIALDSIHSLAKLVQYVKMPHLVQFHVAGLIANSANPMSSSGFLKHLAKESLLISDLGLNLLDFTTTAFRSTLQLFSCLTKLDLVALHASDDPWAPPRPNTIELLPTLDMSDPCPFPALTEFITESQWLKDDTLVNFFRAQLDHKTNSRRLQLHFRCDLPGDVYPFLDRGLEVFLKYTPDKNPDDSPWEGLEY